MATNKLRREGLCSSTSALEPPQNLNYYTLHTGLFDHKLSQENWNFQKLKLGQKLKIEKNLDIENLNELKINKKFDNLTIFNMYENSIYQCIRFTIIHSFLARKFKLLLFFEKLNFWTQFEIFFSIICFNWYERGINTVWFESPKEKREAYQLINLKSTSRWVGAA